MLFFKSHCLNFSCLQISIFSAGLSFCLCHLYPKHMGYVSGHLKRWQIIQLLISEFSSLPSNFFNISSDDQHRLFC